MAKTIEQLKADLAGREQKYASIEEGLIEQYIGFIAQAEASHQAQAELADWIAVVNELTEFYGDAVHGS